MAGRYLQQEASISSIAQRNGLEGILGDHSRLNRFADVIQNIFNLIRVGTNLIEDAAIGLLSGCDAVGPRATEPISRSNTLRHGCFTVIPYRPADEDLELMRFVVAIRWKEEGRGAKVRYQTVARENQALDASVHNDQS